MQCDYDCECGAADFSDGAGVRRGGDRRWPTGCDDWAKPGRGSGVWREVAGHGMGAMADLLRAALVKQPTQNENILSIRVSSMKVTTNPPQKVVVDGEIIGTTPVVFDCIQHGLTVIAPIAMN